MHWQSDMKMGNVRYEVSPYIGLLILLMMSSLAILL